MTFAQLAGGAAVLVALCSGVAQAQGYDPAARYDIDDVMGRHPHDVSELPTREEARGRPVTFDLSMSGTYSSNAGSVRTDPIDAGYLTPAFGINVTPVAVGGGWDIGGGALIDADYYTSDDDAFGEGRLEGFAFASRTLGPGVFTAEVILIGIFSNDFNDHDLDLRIADLTYSVEMGPLDAEVSAEYQGSDIAELRRARLTAMVGHTWDTPVLGHEVTLEGDVAFSDFNDGLNTNRNDATAAVVLVAEKDLGHGWSLEWEAALVHRFSNREQSRFDAFDLGVTVAAAF